MLKLVEQTILLNGKEVVNKIKENIYKVKAELNKKNIEPCLATILVGNDPSSETYVRMKGNACEKAGIKSQKYQLPQNTSTQELVNLIKELNNDPMVHGILLQHPVPEQINERLAFDTIAIDKDVDGVTSWGFGMAALNMKTFPSCTPAAIMEILEFYSIQPEGKHAVVVGRSPILGRPVSNLLLNSNATVTTCCICQH
jgi:methylenetetrahydrofolate dehydrogenase (NADP+) / methenyltetrahydrofolate cyclohydrolase